jgi:hypothetical protein
MLGSTNQKVIPISEGEQDELVIHHDEIYQDNQNFDEVNHLEEIESLVDPLDNDISEAPAKKFVYKKQSMYNRFLKWYRNVDYQYIKDSARWFTESATLEISITVRSSCFVKFLIMTYHFFP